MSECLAAIHLCRVRVTRLDADGTPTAGPNNSYVTADPMVLTVTPNIEAGQDLVLTGGCDCIIAQYRGFDKLKRFDFELDLGKVEPGLMEMMLGATAITDGSNGPIGIWWGENQFDCSTAAQPNLCFEAWQDGWEDDQISAAYPYIHWIWPSTYWQIAPHTLQNDFFQPKLTGFSRRNENWGEGIYGDLPETAQPIGGFFYTDSRPDAECGYQSHDIT